MGFILAAMVAMVAAVAIGIIWRRHRREVRRLRTSHQKAVRELSQEHHRRLERLDREHDRELQSAHHPLVRDLLPAIDSLDEALEHLAGDNNDDSPDELVEGLELARDAIYDALARHDITPVAPSPGEPFDPEIHEAISRRETSDDEPRTIHRLFRPGYQGRQGVLRAALVEVNVEPVYESESADDPSEDADRRSDADPLDDDDADEDSEAVDAPDAPEPDEVPAVDSDDSDASDPD